MATITLAILRILNVEQMSLHIWSPYYNCNHNICKDYTLKWNLYRIFVKINGFIQDKRICIGYKMESVAGYLVNKRIKEANVLPFPVYISHYHTLLESDNSIIVL